MPDATNLSQPSGPVPAADLPAVPPVAGADTEPAARAGPASPPPFPGSALDGVDGVDMAAAYAELQNLLLDDPDLADFLHQVAVLAANVVPGSSCGITMRRNHDVTTVASSDAFASAVDEIQYGQQQGPCLQALRDNTEIAVLDLAADDRWAAYRVHAVTRGVRSSLSLPLAFGGEAIGALNLYGREPYVFAGPVADRARAFAQQAVTALTLVLRRADQAVLEEQLRAAVASRAVIEQAVGIIMGQRRINATDAFAVLREASQNSNRKLTDVAAELIMTFTGEPPRPPRPFIDPR